MKIPDYYRQFQNNSPENKQQEKPQDQQGLKSKDSQNEKQSRQPDEKTLLYQGNGFTIDQLEGWQDKTLYTLTGPVTDGIQHNVIISIDREVQFETLEEYAEWHIKTLEQELKGCTLLRKGETKLTNGTGAFEAIFSWYPTDELKIYQHQVFVLTGKTAFKITASFTKKTRTTLGPLVEKMMLSINPQEPADKK